MLVWKQNEQILKQLQQMYNAGQNSNQNITQPKTQPTTPAPQKNENTSSQSPRPLPKFKWPD